MNILKQNPHSLILLLNIVQIQVNDVLNKMIFFIGSFHIKTRLAYKIQKNKCIYDNFCFMSAKNCKYKNSESFSAK